MSSVLYIVGIGPGDPGLITVRGAEVLQSVHTVFVPVSRADRNSRALEIAEQHLPDGCMIEKLLFPMTRNAEILEKHYMDNAASIRNRLIDGINAALITLGDPSTYSTTWPVCRLFRECSPETAVEIIPGVTSYASAAARAQRALVDGNECLSVVSSYDDPQRIAAIIDASDTVVFLKTYTCRQRVLDIIADKGFEHNCVYIRRCGLEDEQILHDMSSIPEECDYLSMIILKKILT